MQIRFGDCVLDVSTRRLLRGSRATALSPKAYDLLEFLIACRPRALGKRELLKRLWPQTVVVEANLSNLIAEVRAAIGDDSRQPRFIRTIYGFGYAFSGEVEATPADAVGGRPSLCWLAGGGVRVQLPEGEHLIGRHPASIVAIDSPRVSRHHAAIRVERDQATLSDLGSRNGTFVNGRKVISPEVLNDGDRIYVGSTLLFFTVASLGGTTEAAPPDRGARE